METLSSCGVLGIAVAFIEVLGTPFSSVFCAFNCLDGSLSVLSVAQ